MNLKRIASVAGVSVLSVSWLITAPSTPTASADSNTVKCSVKNPWGYNVASYRFIRDNKPAYDADHVTVQPLWYSSTSKYVVTKYRVNILVKAVPGTHSGDGTWWERYSTQYKPWTKAKFDLGGHYENAKGVEVVATLKKRGTSSTVTASCKNFFF